MTSKRKYNFEVIITSRDGLEFANKCMDSICCQTLNVQPHVTYIDDASSYTHSQKNKLINIVSKVNGSTLFLPERCYQIGAIFQGLSTIKDSQSIICLIDGDDYLLPWAFEKLAEAYSNPNVLMTYGNTLVDFAPYQDIQSHYFADKKTVNTTYCAKVWENTSFRKDAFRCFHLRTFRKWLWDKIHPSDFKRPTGEYFQGSGDSAFIFPMLEMLAKPKHIKFIDEPIYVYRLHSKNVHKLDKKSQREDLEYIRFSKNKYKPLSSAYIEQQILGSLCVE